MFNNYREPGNALIENVNGSKLVGYLICIMLVTVSPHFAYPVTPPCNQCLWYQYTLLVVIQPVTIQMVDFSMENTRLAPRRPKTRKNK